MERKSPLLYFAYGSNMNPGQIALRCPGAKRIVAARLPDHRLAFFGHSERWDGGEETVMPAPGQTVHGMVYALAFSALDRLDAWQGVRLDGGGGGGYFHSPAMVFDLKGATFDILMYRKDILGPPRPPSIEYRAHILDGARDCGLPEDYCRALMAIPAEPARYAVPREDDADRFLRSMAGCVC